jgi:hypothetical protein
MKSSAKVIIWTLYSLILFNQNITHCWVRHFQIKKQNSLFLDLDNILRGENEL